MSVPGNTPRAKVELQMLRVLRALAPCPVRDIHVRLNADTGTNYSTTVRMLSEMLQQSLVTCTERQRSHIYKAAFREVRPGGGG
ncbi:MAG: BlaI/MecI/CopY family transcriptional regulator [Fuerstiella sp.]